MNLKLMKISEVAARLSVSMSFVYARIADGSLPHYVLGNGQGAIRVSDEQIQEYLESRERGGEPPHERSQPPSPAARVPLKHLALD